MGKNLIMVQDFMKPYLVPGSAGLGKEITWQDL